MEEEEKGYRGRERRGEGGRREGRGEGEGEKGGGWRVRREGEKEGEEGEGREEGGQLAIAYFVI